MTPAKKKYAHLTLKCLSVVAYILFFATQFNSRYYSVANFFVYGKTNHSPRVDHTPARNTSPVARLRQIPPIIQGHLSIDKRYRVKQPLQLFTTPLNTSLDIAPTIWRPGIPAARLVATDRLLLSLRGPPSMVIS